jgi:hypothetical protein
MALEQELELTHTHGQFTANSGPIPGLSAPMFNVLRNSRSHIQQFTRLRFWLLEYLITARQQLPGHVVFFRASALLWQTL